MYRIADTCVCCHNCACECPMHAISFKGRHYQIDSDLCVECGLCAKLCHTCSIIDDSEKIEVKKHERIVMDCDVVVAGAGSGIVAATRLAQEGKKVILLEKAAVIGGNTDYAHGFFPVYSNEHKKRNIPDVREEAIEVFYERAEKEIEKELLRTAVYGAGEFFDWLCSISDASEVFELVEFGEVKMCGPIYGPAMINFPKRMYDNLLCRDMAIGPGWTGTYVKNACLDLIKEKKLNLRILTGTAARHLKTNECGEVVGILAEDAGGEIEINAKAVILATGGFGRSDEKLRKYTNFFAGESEPHRFSVPTDTGDGIDMLQELGVEPNEDRMYVSIFGPEHHPYSYVLKGVMEQPTCLSVNINGERWRNEIGGCMSHRYEFAKQPKQKSWGIFDQGNIDAIIEKFLNDPALREEREFYLDIQHDLDYESTLEPFAPCRKADTLEDLAKAMEIDADTFLATVKRYNELCEKGIDEDFGKDQEVLKPISDQGPYYAIYGQRFSEDAMGGISVNESCKVLRNDGSIIPGLYGVGDATGAMHRKNKLAVISELTWAFASALYASNNALDYLKEKRVKEAREE